ncbi:MAG: tRNA-dihydrouridine synthase family protein [bacterium]|nr:tRNA-dihydrouridine synthase family protein [bacterium]
MEKNKPTLSLAPIRGATDHIFLKVFQRYFHGIDKAVYPFIDCAFKKKSVESKLRPLKSAMGQGIPLIPQLLSNDAEEFILYANTLYEMGYGTINWNLGCPYPMVVNKGKGSGLLPYPERVKSMLDTVSASMKPALSVKMRLGLSDPHESEQILPLLNNYDLEEIIIHPRTGKDMYTGDINLTVFEKCLSLTKHPVVYNGDITTLARYSDLAERFPSIQQWMIGRGILQNPFLAEEIQSSALYEKGDKIEKIKNFHDDIFSEYKNILSGPAHRMDKMKGLWIYLSVYFENSKKIRKKIKKVSTEKEYKKAVKNIFS